MIFMDYDVIFKRKSIRDYTDEEIDDDSIKTILKAAMQAPSACNTQGWEFLVVKNRENIEKLSKMSKYSGCAKRANTLILVMVNLEKVPKTRPWFAQDLSASTENILLEATNLGIGSVWLGLYPDSKRVQYVKETMDLPLNIVPFSLVALGYPKHEYTIEDRYDESKVHYEKY